MITRRRFLSIVAGAAVLPAVGVGSTSTVSQWRGIALGADAHIILDHPDADRLIKAAVSEIHRLERIFSLYQSNSQISRLNRDGILQNPAFEMIELLSICSRLNARTSGAFDPTVQSLWSLYAEEFSAGRQPSTERISQAMAVTGWQHVNYSVQEVSFDRTGVMMTLNGIAQGFIADKVTELFRQNGVKDVLVNTGEIAALGVAPDGAAWQIKLKSESDRIPLSGAAIATSSPSGTTFDQDRAVGHILDPRTGYSSGIWSSVSVVSHSSADADGLSTAFCLMSKPEVIAAKGDCDVYLR